MIKMISNDFCCSRAAACVQKNGGKRATNGQGPDAHGRDSGLFGATLHPWGGGSRPPCPPSAVKPQGLPLLVLSRCCLDACLLAQRQFCSAKACAFWRAKTRERHLLVSCRSSQEWAAAVQRHRPGFPCPELQRACLRQQPAVATPQPWRQRMPWPFGDALPLLKSMFDRSDDALYAEWCAI